MWQSVTAFFQAIAQTMGFANKRTDLKNAPDVREAAMKVDEQKRIDAIRNNVAKGNLDEIRKDIAG